MKYTKASRVQFPNFVGDGSPSENKASAQPRILAPWKSNFSFPLSLLVFLFHKKQSFETPFAKTTGNFLLLTEHSVSVIPLLRPGLLNCSAFYTWPWIVLYLGGGAVLCVGCLPASLVSTHLMAIVPLSFHL